jgi:hypothetical protein
MVSTLLPLPGALHLTGYTSDGTHLLAEVDESSGGGAEVLVVEVATGVVTDRLPGARHPQPTDDPRQILVVFADGAVGRFDLSTRQRIGGAVDPGFAPDGIVEHAGGTLAWRRADLEREEPGVIADLGAPGTRLLEDFPGPRTLRVTPNGTVFTMKGAVERRDPGTLAIRAESEPNGPMAFAAADDVVVVSNALGEHAVLDASTLAPEGSPLPATRGFFTDMVMDRAGARLLALGADNEVRLYDIAARSQVGTGVVISNRRPTIEPRGLALRADGLQAAVGTDDGIVLLDLDPDRWVEAACTVASRNLTDEEWDTYLGTLGPYHTTCPDFPPATE